MVIFSLDRIYFMIFQCISSFKVQDWLYHYCIPSPLNFSSNFKISRAIDSSSSLEFFDKCNCWRDKASYRKSNEQAKCPSYWTNHAHCIIDEIFYMNYHPVAFFYLKRIFCMNSCVTKIPLKVYKIKKKLVKCNISKKFAIIYFQYIDNS